METILALLRAAAHMAFSVSGIVSSATEIYGCRRRDPLDPSYLGLLPGWIFAWHSFRSGGKFMCSYSLDKYSPQATGNAPLVANLPTSTSLATNQRLSSSSLTRHASIFTYSSTNPHHAVAQDSKTHIVTCNRVLPCAFIFIDAWLQYSFSAQQAFNLHGSSYETLASRPSTLRVTP